MTRTSAKQKPRVKTHAAREASAAMALDLPPSRLDMEMEAYFGKCMEKLGFVPNVLRAYSFNLAKLKTFVALSDELMLAPSGLSKLEREMIAVTVSCANFCHYCAHAGVVRKFSGDAKLGDTIAANYRAASLDRRTRAMLDFAWKMTIQPWAIDEDDRNALRKAGFNDRDIWDIAAVAGFFAMSNRIASATEMLPNDEYYDMGR